MKRFWLLFVFLIVLALLPVCLLLAGSDSGGNSNRSSNGTPTYTLEQAVLTALRQNADILRAREDIERTKGLYISMRAEILPRVDVKGEFTDTDPHLEVDHGGPEVIPTPGATPITLTSTSFTGTERSYTVQIVATQVIFAGGRIVSQIRAADFTRDASYYAFRDVVDQVVSTTRVQFYQIILDRALVGVKALTLSSTNDASRA